MACDTRVHDEMDILNRPGARQLGLTSGQYVEEFLAKWPTPDFSDNKIMWDFFLMVVGPMRENHGLIFKNMSFYGAYVVSGGLDEWGFLRTSPALRALGIEERSYRLPDGRTGIDPGNNFYHHAFLGI